MVAISKLAVAALLALAVNAEQVITIYRKDDLAIKSCTTLILKAVIFYKKDKKGYCNTENQPALGTMAHCLKQTPHQGGIKQFLEDCKEFGLTEEKFWAAYDNATDYMVANVTAYPGFDLKKPFYLPVKFGQKKVTASWNSNLHRWYNYNYANYFGWVLLGYWFFLVLISGAIRLMHHVAPGVFNSFNGKISNTFKKYVTVPALFGGKRAEYGRLFRVIDFVIPSRIESIQIFVWCVLVVIFNAILFKHDKNNTIWKVKYAEMGRKMADRTGIIAVYMVPQLILFAGRNNFLQWISGWSYARFNVIHHWYGRMCFLMMALHAVGMTLNGVGIGKYHTRNGEAYVRWGYVAVCSAAVMLIHSIGLLRTRHYEIFVFSHNVLGVLFVAGAWIHTKDQDFQEFFYAATAVWAFDKAMRLVRMAWFGVRTAEVRLIADETLKVTVPRPASWKATPLSHSFLYFMRPSCFWQSHPFTFVDSVVEKNLLTFYLKVKGGVTHGLCRFLSTQPEQKSQIKVCVEGPYGVPAPLQHYAAASFISGGNGIPGLYAAAVDLARKTTGKNVKLYWVIRHWKTVEWFYEELRALEHLNVNTTVFVTKYNTPLETCFMNLIDSSDASLEEKKSDLELADDNVKTLLEKLPFIKFVDGRPDLEGIIKLDIEESTGAIAFVACGHNAFVDESRRIITNNLVEGKRVDFLDQMQTW